MPFGDGYHDEDFEADCDRERAEEAAERREVKREERAQRADPATFAAPRVINLNEREVECVICGADATGHQCGLPMYEGLVVPMDYRGSWCGFPSCRDCLAAYQAGGPNAVHARRKQRW